MLKDPSKKYRPFPPVALPDRQWPNRVLTAAPRWCSVDLRDGNQALAVPMNVSQKLELFSALVKIGFKEIEVGFPSASNTEFTFNRRLIEEKRAPDDVWLQVLVQAREDLIERTVESLVGAKRVIIHMYNSTSPAQRRVVFGKSKDEIKAIAVQGAKWIKDRLPRLKGTEVMLQYSPESFSMTEVEYAKEISEAVMDVWQPTPQRKMILNLPDTVEVAMPNVYADQIEWMCRNIKNRDSLVISLHTHNDRSTGVAATELGLLAGADRVEGTLFGNGERTGNLDLVTVALNLYMHGIDPKLDFANVGALIEVYERCTGMTVPPRHPYAGELVFTAFSGSHQDAIKKGLAEREKRERTTSCLSDTKKEFLNRVNVTNEASALKNTIGASFQRNKIYASNASPERRNSLRTTLKDLIKSTSEQYFDKQVDEATHCNNIKKLSDSLSQRFGEFLVNSRFNIGTTQKALNLYLKFMWCLDRLKFQPPHCPIDSIVLKEARLRDSWTKCDSLANYKKWVECIRFRIGKKSLAEWELELWQSQTKGGLPSSNMFWDVPYLTIDPADIGREYHEVIRVNSQSGKGGVAYLLETEFGIALPKDMQREFGPIANDTVDKLGREVSGAELKAMFWKEYIERTQPWQLSGFETESKNGVVKCRAKMLQAGKPVEFSGEGNGPLAALVHGFSTAGVPRFEITNYSEHALGSGEEASAISYIQIKTADGKSRWGAGVDTNIELASVRAVLSALNRS